MRPTAFPIHYLQEAYGIFHRGQAGPAMVSAGLSAHHALVCGTGHSGRRPGGQGGGKRIFRHARRIHLQSGRLSQRSPHDCGKRRKQPVHLQMMLKSMGCLFTLFTFRESTPVANARARLFVTGDVPQACAAVRILDIVQVYLLPKPIAKLAIKRYPKWSVKRHTLDRARVLVRTLLGV